LSLIGLAGVLEGFGGLMIRARAPHPARALVLLMVMLAGYVMAHLPRGVWPILNGGEPALLYTLAFTFLAASGAGPLSVDHRKRIRRESAEPTGRGRNSRGR
jgi:putative oxidoreductase